MTEPTWSQLAILTATKNFELVTNALIMQQIVGIENLPEDQGLAIYLPSEQLTTQWCQQLKEELAAFGLTEAQYQLQITENVDMHWGKSWQPYYQTVPITHFMSIVPSWQKQEANSPYDIIIDPEESFGTGEHPTTKLCLQALEQVITNQQTMIDVGTGTGILAIAGYKFGIQQIFGYDLERDAVQVARANFALNSTDTSAFVVQQNSLLTDVDQTADLIVANMLLEPITALIPQLNSHLNADGKVIISGILTEQVAQITPLLDKANLEIVQTASLSGWECLIIQNEVV